ncbi:MAG TPA: hypothetical protein VMQ54_11955 [Steroidobacteraceae bacterium]|nr:hypothetical protein [Steroidobacteraceae bacterium]
MARQFTRPPPGNRYSAEERAAWGREQDRLRALRNAPGYQKPAPAKRPSRAKTLTADTSDSECFDSLTYKNGVVTASFIGPAAGVWEYSMSRAEAAEWFSDDSLGGYFNDNVREPPAKGN